MISFENLFTGSRWLIFCAALFEIFGSQSAVTASDSSAKLVFMIREFCFQSEKSSKMESLLKQDVYKYFKEHVRVEFFNYSGDVCQQNVLIIPEIISQLKHANTVAIIGSFDPALCNVVQKIVKFYNKHFFTWSCSQVSFEINEKIPDKFLYPAVKEIVTAVLTLFKHFRWKKVFVITYDGQYDSWWTKVSADLNVRLSKNVNLSLSTSSSDDYESAEFPTATESSLPFHLNATFIVLPVTSEIPFIKKQLMEKISRDTDRFRLKSAVQLYNETGVIISIPNSMQLFWNVLECLNDVRVLVPTLVIDPAFYRLRTVVQPIRYPDNKCQLNESLSQSLEQTSLATDYRTSVMDDDVIRTKKKQMFFVTINYWYKSLLENDNDYFAPSNESIYSSGKTDYRNVSSVLNSLNYLRNVIMLLVPSSTHSHLPELKNPIRELSRMVTSTLENVIKINRTADQSINQVQAVNFALMDMSNSSWRSLMLLNKTKLRSCERCINYNVTWFVTDLENLLKKKVSDFVTDESDQTNGSCDGPNCSDNNGINTVAVDVTLLTVIGVTVLTMFLSCIGLFFWRQYTSRNMVKSSCKILLTTDDITFPQIAEPRKVEEGIEAMLCCWLHQLQEFGGLEVDKPDLLKGPDDSVKSFPMKHTNSCSSVTRPIASGETKARYNGDLVQLKDIPSTTSSFELRTKSLDVLMMVHGLRHENLNPLIGLLVDPKRPALVWEYCSRGSLEDVLIQDEIKLDWSFRLSLLTDLVRGMRYLHSCYRIHGSLSSRNCVIDARWVLKITDYGLQEFYEAQNIEIPSKVARDLLWTAPELLRNEDPQRRGTQQGDVYSFAIIMQEVVVRGEPYCMLSLSPEEAKLDFDKNYFAKNWRAPNNSSPLRTLISKKRGALSGRIVPFTITRTRRGTRLSADYEDKPFIANKDIIEKLKKPPPLIRPSVSKGAAPPEAINIMRQCWAEQPDKRPDFNAIYDLFKTLNHGRKINFVDTMFQMLEKYSNNLEDLIRERTEQLDMEKKKTEQLLNRMLPSSVAEKLKLGMPVDPEEFSEVTIYFSDIVGFTTISAYSTPFEVVDLLNDLYTCFDATINAYNVYKVETIGDAYMVVGGLPVRIPDHADQIATMALDLLHQCGRFKIRHLPLTPLRLRIGLHTGPCCAGVVGLTMPRYCLFGDTVNTASRLESTGSPGRIHLSEATKLKLDKFEKFKIEYRGETELRGKGKMRTYWLISKDGFEKELPIPPPVTLDEDLIRLSRPSKLVSSNSCQRLPSEGINVLGPGNSSGGELNYSPKRLIVQKSLDTSLLLNENCVPVHSQPVRNCKRQMTYDSFISNERNEYSSRKTKQPLAEYSSKTESVSSIVSSSDLFPVPDKSADLLGVPFVNFPNPSVVAAAAAAAPSGSAASGTFKLKRHICENDLSSAYNYYRCLAPTNENATVATGGSSKFVSKFLKRQYSMDKSDESPPIVLQDFPVSKSNKLLKQNSIEIATNKSTGGSHCNNNSNSSMFSSKSISVESLHNV